MRHEGQTTGAVVTGRDLGEGRADRVLRRLHMRVRELTLSQVLFLLFAAIVIFLSISVVMFGWLSSPSGV